MVLPSQRWRAVSLDADACVAYADRQRDEAEVRKLIVFL
jgi:hypothetical protein